MRIENRTIRIVIRAALALVLLSLLALLLIYLLEPEWSPFLEEEEDVEETLIPGEQGFVHHQRSAYLTHLAMDDIGVAPLPAPYSLGWRTGIGIPDLDPMWFKWPAPRPGWYLNWSTNRVEQRRFFGLWRTVHMELPDEDLGMEFVPMVRIRRNRLLPRATDLRRMAAQNPGRTWLIGNEPDVRWQDNVRPERYAELYYDAYTAIKRGDPTAQVAIGGLSQITPLRLVYLDRVWAAYQAEYGEPMPVDVWNMHAFVLREERGNWGVGMPPGFTTEQLGMLWDIDDHADLRLVEEQIRRLRQWMAEHDQQAKPLWITEYGILMPESYGFPPAVVQDFMLGSFALFDNLRDPKLGYAADENRLVQRWVWFSTLYNPYPAGNLFNISGRPKVLMRAWSEYLAERE